MSLPHWKVQITLGLWKQGLGHNLRSLGTRAQRPQPNSPREFKQLFSSVTGFLFKTFTCQGGKKNREIVYDLWSFFFFNLEAEWTKTMELTPEECGESHLVFHPSVSAVGEWRRKYIMEWYWPVWVYWEFGQVQRTFDIHGLPPSSRTRIKEPQISHHFIEPWSPHLENGVTKTHLAVFEDVTNWWVGSAL